MKIKIPPRLSAKATKQWLRAEENDRIGVLIQIAPSANPDDVSRQLQELEGNVESWLEEPRLLGAVVVTNRLDQVASLPGVTYVEVEEGFSH